MEGRLQEQLDRRQREGTLRSLIPLPKQSDVDKIEQNIPTQPIIDFASNDYLGLARCKNQHALVQSAYDDTCSNTNVQQQQPTLGSAGSRLLSGDSNLARSIEAKLANIHNRQAALLFNSGYDANLSILSSLPYNEDDCIVMDELVHNSLVMGIRMSRLNKKRVVMFKHNDVVDLKKVLEKEISSRPVSSTLVVVESVYSMDGDVAPLKDILELAKEYNARVMVDEAHGLGVYGKTNLHDLKSNSINVEYNDGTTNIEKTTRGGTGVLAALNLEHHSALFCSIHTFGKAAGCHGAVVAGSNTLISYLVNYARPFVYSTALPTHSLVTIQQSYESMMGNVGEDRRKKVFQLVRLFRKKMLDGIDILKQEYPNSDFELLPSPSPIQAIVVPGNEQCISVCQYLRNVGNLDVYPIRSPTVTKGKERIRIILHSHNTENEVNELTTMIILSLRKLMSGSINDKKIISKL